jgi:hypothetical protein
MRDETELAIERCVAAAVIVRPAREEEKRS